MTPSVLLQMELPVNTVASTAKLNSSELNQNHGHVDGHHLKMLMTQLKLPESVENTTVIMPSS